ncbi:MAG TPA: DHA2 family efflux MFS transporter permease subunit [Candidatus Kapabacteria bacterium]|nr:DHA2 family efflux MFS transporter permease subunit [Candidatus Kapabacteria bacterium]
MGLLDGIKKKFVVAVPSLHHAHPRYRWWVLFNVMIGTFMAVLDATIVDVALTKIMGSFGADIDKVEWVITAYMLVFAVMLPTSGWVADHFGYKRTYFTGLMFFTLGSFLCGFAWDENALIMFRVIQGAGAGLMMPVGMAIVTREFPVEKRGIALGFWTIAAAASVSLGPLIGGYLVDNIGWNAIFDINVPVGMVAMFATLVIQREYRMEQSRSFDIVGFLSGSIFVSALLLALADGNASWNTGGWSSLFIITCFFISAVALIVFLVTEFTTEHPLIDLKLLKNFNFGIANAVMFIFGMGMFGSTFLLPLYLQNALGYTALQAGAVFLPVGIVQALMSPTAGFISDKINPKIPAVIGLAMLGIGLLLNSSLSLFSESNYIMIPLLLRGFGMGLLFTPLATLALAEIPRHKMAQASGLFNIIRQIGGSFGVAIMGTLLTRRMMYHTATFGQAVDQGSPAYRQVAYGLSRFAQVFDGSAMGTAMVQAKALIISHIAQQAFVRAVCDDFFVAAIVTLIGVIPIMVLRAHKKQKGEHIAAME